MLFSTLGGFFVLFFFSVLFFFMKSSKLKFIMLKFQVLINPNHFFLVFYLQMFPKCEGLGRAGEVKFTIRDI